ncbi:hypothetical protein COCNU_02G017440 [Cocos nucifera]|uniref:Uncharacterized protein n=1 Tax=Cocos nucifera TaxID=13894 RepID=A0A8K0MXK8_COCNU|nr:hypothetical protein COCNU_02G017440 [Cocos nucifera]
MVLVRNIPPDPDESVSEHVEHFFSVNHHGHYLTHQKMKFTSKQHEHGRNDNVEIVYGKVKKVVYNANNLAKLVDRRKSLQNWLVYYENKNTRNPEKRPRTKTGFLGLWGKAVDAIDYYTAEIEKLSKEEATERERLVSDPKAIMPAAFVSFRTRWGAAVCAQTQQSSNPTLWLTEWAPEPRDVYWSNLAIPFVELTMRRLIMAVAFFFLTFFFMIPIAFVQSLANIEGIEKVVPFLKPLIEKEVVSSFIKGFLSGIALKIFMIFLPTILMIMSKIEGYISISALERKSAAKFYLFILVNVFLANVIAGAAFEQLNTFVNKETPNKYPVIVGTAIPAKATFFITYIMLDGWAGVASEILRLKPLIIYHLKNTFLVKTEQDREQAMDPGSLDFASSEPRIQLYFLLGLVYSVVTPIFLPFLVVFFSLSYVVFRHQEATERERLVSDPKAIMPAAFVSFRTRWGAAVCAQTQQSSNPTLWLTEWAPEPRDVYWSNLAIPFVELTMRRLIMAVAFFFLTFFFMIPIAFVQSLANIEGIEKVVPFLKPLIEKEVVSSFIKGFLSGIALKIFMIFLPTILMIMSKIEGYISISALERKSAAKFYLFILVNVFLANVIAGAAFEQLNTFVNKETPNKYPVIVGTAIPAKATFFITYIMLDGWAGVASEILRLKPLIIYHLKNTFLVKTEQDREQAMDPGSLDFASSEPRIQLYFLLGLVYSVVTPIFLPFLVVFFSLSYVVFRHQVH